MIDIEDRLTEYCLHGGLYNPELMQHDKVRDLLIDCRAEIARLREAIRRLADQDATLSVCNGSVTVQMDATPEILAQLSQRGGPLVPFDPPQPTLTDEEWVTLNEIVHCFRIKQHSYFDPARTEDTLRKLMERLGGER